MKLAPALALLVLPALLTAAACAEKGGTTTTGEDSSSSTTAVTDPGTTENPTEPIATVTSATDTTGCGPNECGACECGAQDECVDGEWVCECSDCSTSSGSTGDTDGSGISCTSEPQVFPSFDRTCAAVEDCSLVFHQVDCCGTLVAWGLNSNDAKPFAEVESVCQMQFMMCDCMPMPTVTDDGKTVEDVVAIMVACMDGMCHSFLP